jgi:DNA-binding NarL/FixJ family response regulator
LLADDHPPTREELRLALERDEGFMVCAEGA